MERVKCSDILALVLIVFIIFWTYNIFFNNLFPVKEVEESKYQGVIKICDYPRLNVETGNRYGWMQEKIRNFEKMNPGVYIEFTPLEWESNIQEELKKGYTSDIIPVGTDFSEFKLLEPLDEYFDEQELKQFKTQALTGVSYGENILAFPVALTTYTMYLNLDLFNKRGVSPPVDGEWTYEEFVETLKKLTFNEDGIDYYGFISFINPNYYNLWGIIFSDGAQIIDTKTNNYVFYGEKALRGLEKVIDLKEKYRVTPDFFGVIGEEECWEMFYKDKKVAVYPTGSWAVKVLENLKKEGEGFNFEVANYPIGNKKLPITVSNGIVSYGIIKQEDEKKMEMCMDFLKYLGEEKNQRTLEDIGLFTVKKDINDMYKDNPNMKKIEESISYTYYLPMVDNWEEIDKTIQEEIRLAIVGKKASFEAIEDCKNKVKKLTK